jgi:hypothetical protein
MDKDVMVALIGIVPSSVLGLVALVSALRRRPKRRKKRPARRKREAPAVSPPLKGGGEELRRAEE